MSIISISYCKCYINGSATAKKVHFQVKHKMNFWFFIVIKNHGVFGYPTNLTKLS